MKYYEKYLKIDKKNGPGEIMPPSFNLFRRNKKREQRKLTLDQIDALKQLNRMRNSREFYDKKLEKHLLRRIKG